MSIRHKLFLVLLLIRIPVTAQAPVKVSGKAAGVLRDDLARAVQIQQLIEEAQLDAIRQQSGTNLMIAEQYDLQSTGKTGEQENIRKDYQLRVNSFSSGTWIRNTHEPLLEYFTGKDGQDMLRVEVSGYARIRPLEETAIRCGTSSCPGENCHTRLFKEGDALYLWFQAEPGGYLIAAVEDPVADSTYILQREDGFPLRVESTDEIRIPDNRTGEYGRELEVYLNEEKDNSRQFVWMVYTDFPASPPVASGTTGIPVMSARSYRQWMYETLLRDEEATLRCIPISVISNEAHEQIR